MTSEEISLAPPSVAAANFRREQTLSRLLPNVSTSVSGYSCEPRASDDRTCRFSFATRRTDLVQAPDESTDGEVQKVATPDADPSRPLRRDRQRGQRPSAWRRAGPGVCEAPLARGRQGDDLPADAEVDRGPPAKGRHPDL